MATGSGLTIIWGLFFFLIFIFFNFFLWQAGSQFQSQVLLGGLNNVANNRPGTYWPNVEGNASTQYCDLMVDWWPDAWAHPVGYHVTLPCTGAAHRTFDAAWTAVAVGSQVQMYYTPDALRDRNRSTSAFGASGLCRSHSVAMPMDILNPIRLCTQADNQPADPMVPAPRAFSAPQWGPELCSGSPFDVPWDPVASPLAPASVGTLPPGGAMALLQFNGWNVDGPQPLRQCATGADCCPTCSCLLTPTGGVCAVLQKGVFECLAHAHCAPGGARNNINININDTMCGGDGLCTRGVMEVTNSLASSEPVAFRTYSSNCSGPGLHALDTWGISKEEVVPDILNASGMCSYRSWYEHRQLVQQSACSASQCTLQGTDVWNFTDPGRSPRPAFEAGVLHTRPHACDVDYEHLAGLQSCAPVPAAAGTYRLVDANGNVAATLLAQSNRTRTYRLVNGAAQLPVVRHPNTASNPGAGFLGPDLSYTALGYDTYSQASAIPSARPRLCSSLALCSTQSAWNLWFVNGVQEPARFVPVSGGGGQRAYSTTDMIACGSMGYLVDSGTTTCQIDPGVAPLFAVTCQATPTAALCQTYPGGRYTSYRSASSLGQLAASLNALLVSVTTPASDWPSYLTAVGNADTLYPKILAQRPSPVYWYSTGTPTGVYYLAEYAAYEVPYAWWFRCTWLMGVRPSATLTPCAAWDAASAATPNINDADGAPVFDTATASSSSGNNVPLLQWLASLGAGVFTQATVNAARDAAHTAFANLVATQKGVAPPARYNFGCRASARLRADLLSKSGDYAQAVLANLNRRWSTAVPNLCDGFATCLDHGPVALVPGLNLFADVLARITPLGACPSASGCACTTSLPSAQQVCAYMQDSVPSQMPAVDPQQTTATPTLPLFKAPSTLLPTLQSQNAFAGLAARYDTKPDGCNTYPNYNCRDPAGCQCLFPTVQPNELAAAGLSPTDVQPNAPAVVAFGTSASIYVCGGSPLSSPGARCDLQSAPPSDVCVSESQTARTTMALYCDSLAAKGVAMFSAFNPASEQCLMSACFGGARIGGTRISIPPGVGVDVVSALSIPCYTLSCPGNPSNDKRVVLNPTPFTFNVFTQYRFYVLQIDYTMPDVTHTQRIHRAQLLDGRTNTVLANIQNHVCANMYGMSTTVRAVMEVASALSQSTPFPIFICTPNARNTRSKGRDFETKRHKTAGYLSKERTPAKWDQIMVDMVNAVEVGIDSSSEFSDAGILCGLSLPNNLKACNFSEPVSSPTAPRISDSLAIALACSDKDTLAACNELGATMCAQESNVRTYDKVKCTAARAGVALLVLGGPLGVLAAIAAEVGVNELPVCYQGQTPFEKCMNSYKDLGTCRSKFQIKCNWYMYQRDINESPCTSTAGQCSYDERYQDRTWEQQYKDAGLPTAGFCPACTGPLCPPSKDSSTFFLAQSATGLHTLTTRAVQDGDTLPAAAQHARIRLGTVGPPGGSRQAAQCSSTPIQCQSSIHRPVQYRLGLQTCVPCFAAPAVQCTGTHMCGFYASDGNDDQNVPGNPTTESFPDYATALQDAINTAQATLSSLRAGLRPLWRPWLAASGAFLQQGYNPSVLFQGFNAAILQLNGQCQIGGQLPDPSQCQNDGPRRAVRTHVQSQYKLGEGAVVPPGATLSYYVPASLLTGTNLAAWDSTARGAPFLQALLNDSVCAQFTYESLVCIQQPATGVTMLLNPLIAGDFEVRVGCDATLMDGTTRAISSSCNQLACSTASASSDRYNSYVNGGDGTASWTACKLKDHQLATDYTTRRDAPTNLCYKRPATPSRCGVPQGAQAQWGRAGAPVSTLYGYAGASPPNRSTLLQLATGATRNLGVSPWDLGGHHIRLTLSADGALRVTGLPLRSSATLAIAQAMNGTMAWPAQWAKQAAQRVVSATQCRSWACPFRRRFYWTGQRQASTVVTPFAAFGPTVPDAARTQAVYGTTSHPSAPFPSSASTVLSQLLSDYRTSNGFCACPAGSAQLCVSTFYSMRPPGAAFTPNASPCSQAELVNALLDLQPRTASVLNTSNSTCTYQLDWPWPGGPLRDGSWLPSGRVPPASCGALDRLPPFRYRFNNSRTKLPAADGATTLDEGGDCHMGRAARAASVESLPALATCVVTAKTADRVTLACPDGSTPTLPRPTSASVLNSASQAARRPCGTCDPLPAFFAGANNQSLPTPETSYGRPWRWSASRLLARDLRFKLCGNDTRCPAVQSQAWTTANFWPKMAAGTLFRPTPAPDALNTRLQTQRQRQQARGLGPDAASWDEPWLLCTTNASGRSCSGSISKADWLSGNRPDLCRAVLAQPNAPSAAVDLSICDLDASLNSLCSVIQQARYDVFEANCQLTGQCRTTSFFYQPATYALDDSAFVRSVVGTFYNFTSPGSCPVLDDETQAVLASNRQAVQGCPAQDLEVFNYAIQIAREALHSFVIIGYYSGMIFVDLIALITATDTTPLVNSILAYFNRIASEFQQFFAAFGDLVYKMVMETGKLGKALKAIITALCAFMREIFYPIVRPFMCAIQSFAIVIFDTLSAIIEGVSFLVGGALNGLAEGLTKASDAINSFSMCNAENPFHCDTLFPPDTNGPTSLPMPTRCWVGYIPAAGDRPQDGLGCSASDTCMDDDGSLRACGACVASLSGASYACDSLTKLCRCTHTHTFVFSFSLYCSRFTSPPSLL